MNNVNQKCNHIWTGFVQCVTLNKSNKYMCIECGKVIHRNDVICRNGKLYKDIR